MRAVLLCLALSFVVLGCKGQPAIVLKNPGPAKMASGWDVATSRDGSVSIGMPSGWGKSMPGMLPTTPVGDDSGATPDPQLQELTKHMDSMNAQEDAKLAEQLEAKGILLTVYQQGTRPTIGEEVTRYFVQKKATGGNATMADATEPYTNANGKPRKTEVVHLPIGDASMFHIVHNLKDGGVVNEWNYVIPAKENIYTVTFITEADANTFEQMREDTIKSLRIKA